MLMMTVMKIAIMIIVMAIMVMMMMVMMMLVMVIIMLMMMKAMKIMMMINDDDSYDGGGGRDHCDMQLISFFYHNYYHLCRLYHFCVLTLTIVVVSEEKYLPIRY